MREQLQQTTRPEGQWRSRYVTLVLLGSIAASALAFHHPNTVLSMLITAPGYLVQAWLFERHRALGGTGYVVTMIGVSALCWTVIAIGFLRGTIVIVRRFKRG